jgi:hypothetical protein
MATRPAHTVIFLGVHRTDRVDFGPGPQFPAVGQFHKVSQDEEDPAIRAESLLISSPRVGKSVWILWEGASTQMLDMPAGVVEGLDHHELIESLSFEAETLSGVPASDSAMDAVRQDDAGDALSELRRFWVTQVPASERGRLEEALRRVNAKLAGIAHPGGLPRAYWEARAGSETAGGEWRRLEVWNQLTISLHGKKDGVIETRVIRSTPGSEGWLAELPTAGPISWMGPTPANRIGPDGQRVTLLGGGGIPLQPEKIDLPADAAPVEWLRAWVTELTARPRRVPCVLSASSESPNRRFFIAGGLLTSLALAVCAAHGTWLTLRTGAEHDKAAKLELEAIQFAKPDTSGQEVAQIIGQIQQLQPKFDANKQQIAQLQGDVNSLQTTLDTLVSQHAQLVQLQTIHRQALPELVAALVDSSVKDNPADLVVKEIREESSGNLRLTGLCRISAFADDFATNLESRLSKSGWLLSPATKQLRDDGAYNFVIELTPVVRFKGWGIAASGIDATQPSSRPAGPVSSATGVRP